MADANAGDGGAAASSLTYEQQLAQDKAAFLAGDDVAEQKSKPAASVSDDADDEDADLDASADEDTEVEAVASDDDEDADLEDEDADLKLDPDAAKRMEQVRRTEQRMRDRLEQQFSVREQQLAAREEQLKPRLEKLDRFEKLAERVRYEPESVLLELGATEDDLEHATKRLYAFTKAGKSDPKVREAVDRLAKERERDERLRKLEAERVAEREEAKQREQIEAQRRDVDSYVAKVTKLAGEKTPLTKRLFEADPEAARAEFEVVAGTLAQKLGKLPDHKMALVEFEKHQRRMLRRYGVDPRTLTPAQAAAAAAKPTEKKAPAPAAKKATKVAAATSTDDTDDSKPLTKADFIRERGRSYA